jgi:hypothetical protein
MKEGKKAIEGSLPVMGKRVSRKGSKVSKGNISTRYRRGIG